jgi:hypothetical protein
MSKFAGFIVGAAVAVVGIATGNLGLIIQGGAMIVLQGIVLLTMPKQPARQASEMSIALGEQPRSALFGETYTAGSLVDGFNYGGKYDTDWEVLIIRLADHKCEGLTGFFVNDEYTPFTHNGRVAKFDDQLNIYFRSDTSAQPLPAVVTDEGPKWHSSDKGLSGCDVVVEYKADKPQDEHPGWPGGRPRFGFVVRGKYCYDPRRDDTVTGGSGDHRWDDPDTWEFSDNPVVCRYNWVRGIYAEDDVSDQTKLLVGRGLTAEEAPPENVIAPANVCDEGNNDHLPYYQSDEVGVIGYLSGVAIADGATWLVRWTNGNAGTIEHWHLPSRTVAAVTGGGDAEAGTVINVDVAADGRVYYYAAAHNGLDTPLMALWEIDAEDVGKQYLIDDMYWIASLTRVFDLEDGSQLILGSVLSDTSDGYFLKNTHVPVSGLMSRDFALHGDGSVWGVFEPDLASTLIVLQPVADTSESPIITFNSPVTRTDDGDITFCHVAKWRHFFVIADGIWMIVSDDTTTVPGTIIATGSWSGTTLNLPRKSPAAETFWVGYKEVSLETGATIRTVVSNDWLSEDSGSVDRVIYDPVSHALIAHPQFGNHLTWRYLISAQRYRIAGPVYANQEFLEVEEMFAAACAGSVVTRGGSVELEPGQAKSIVATFTDDDLISGSQVNYNQGVLSDSNQEWVNTVVARYVEPKQMWTDHGAPVVRDTDDILSDGRPREAQITLRLVRDVGQALRIAEITRRLGRIWGRASVTLGPRFCEIEDNDWVSWTSARHFNGGTKVFQVGAYSIDEKWQNKLTLREINASVYDDDGDFDEDLSIGTPRPPLPRVGKPDEGQWTLTAGTLVSAGASVPALLIDGSASDDSSAESILIEIWKSDLVSDPLTSPNTVPWTSVGRYAPDTTHIEITSITGGETYYAAVSYVVSGTRGRQRVLGPVTVGDLDVSGQIPPIPTTLNDLSDVTAPTPVDGQVLTWDSGTSQWVSESVPAPTGLVIGTNIQAWDADLDALAGLAAVQGDVIYRSATQWQRLPAGIAGNVLQTGGAGANPTWASSAAVGGQAAIETRILVGASASETFTIPAGYRDIKIVIRARGDAAGVSTVNVQMRLNGDTAANYDDQRLQGTNAASSAAQNIAQTSARIGSATGATAVANEASLNEVTIYEYAGTTFRKVAASRCVVKAADSSGSLFVLELGQWWRSTAAVTSATFFPSSGNFVAGTTFTVYGLT